MFSKKYSIPLVFCLSLLSLIVGSYAVFAAPPLGGDIVHVPNSTNINSIEFQFITGGYLKGIPSIKDYFPEYFVGNHPIDVAGSDGKLLVPFIMQSVSANILEAQIPQGVVLKTDSNSSYLGTLPTPTEKPTSVATVDNVLNVASFGEPGQRINFKNQGDQSVNVTLRVPAHGGIIGNFLKIYYSDDNDATWNFLVNTPVVNIGGYPYVEFSTTHFTDFAIAQGTGVFVIAGDATTTATLTNVILNMSMPQEPTQMRFSNDGIVRSTWEAYTNIKYWNLSQGMSTKTVYAEFDMDGDNNAEASTSDTIFYDGGVSTQGDITLSIFSGTSFCVYGTAVDLGTQGLAPDFGAMVFTGDFVTESGTNSWSCTDFAGTPAGWDLTIQSTDLVNQTSNTILASNVKINHNEPMLSAGDCQVGGYTAIDQSIDTVHTILSKQPSTGRSICRVQTDNVQLRVDVPANQAPGTYIGTLTLTLPSFE